MADDGREPFLWLQRNRARPAPEASVGTLVAAWVDIALDGGSRLVHRLVEALAAVVDDEFRMHARVHVDELRRIVIAVDRPELVFAVRMRWGERVRREVRMISGLSQSPVQFICGDQGVRIPAPRGD